MEDINAQLDAIIEAQKRLIEHLDRRHARWEKEREERSRRFELQLKELAAPGIGSKETCHGDPE